MLCDNKNVVDIAQNRVYHSRMKQICVCDQVLPNNLNFIIFLTWISGRYSYQASFF